MQNNTPKNPATLEEIAIRKQDLLKQIRKQSIKIQVTASDLFTPVTSENKMEMFMNSVNSGIAMYDGVMTGVKLMRRIRRFFKSKKK